MTNLEHIEEHVKLDSLLPPHSMIHLTCVRNAMQQHQRPSKDCRLGEVALVAQSKMPLPRAARAEERVPEGVGDELDEGGDGAEGKDGEGVEEGVEADEDAENDNLQTRDESVRL